VSAAPGDVFHVVYGPLGAVAFRFSKAEEAA
jgi:2-keto-4-pentenoate hydratase